MNLLGESFATLPMPFVWLLVIGLVFWSRPVVGRRLVAVTTVAFFISSLAIVGKIVLLAFLATVPVWEAGMAPKPVAIIVPTGGIFADETGRWWPSSSSIHRAVMATQLRQQLDVPLIISGGAPVNGQPPEARVIATELALTGPAVILETTARNSQETGQAVAGIMKNLPVGPVMLATSDMHVARMGAVLRHAGLSVRQPSHHRETVKRVVWTDFIPSTLGLAYSARLSRESWAILWYVVKGYLSLHDFVAGSERPGSH